MQSRDQPAAPWAHLGPEHPHSHRVVPLTGLKWGDSSRLGRHLLPAAPCLLPRPHNGNTGRAALGSGRGGGAGSQGARGPIPHSEREGGVWDPIPCSEEVGSGVPVPCSEGRGGSRAPFLAVRSPPGNPAVSPQLSDPGQGHAGAGGRGAAPGGAGGRLHRRRVSAGGARAALLLSVPPAGSPWGVFTVSQRLVREEGGEHLRGLVRSVSAAETRVSAGRRPREGPADLEPPGALDGGEAPLQVNQNLGLVPALHTPRRGLRSPSAPACLVVSGLGFRKSW